MWPGWFSGSPYNRSGSGACKYAMNLYCIMERIVPYCGAGCVARTHRCALCCDDPPQEPCKQAALVGSTAGHATTHFPRASPYSFGGRGSGRQQDGQTAAAGANTNRSRRPHQTEASTWVQGAGDDIDSSHSGSTALLEAAAERLSRDQQHQQVAAAHQDALLDWGESPQSVRRMARPAQQPWHEQHRSQRMAQTLRGAALERRTQRQQAPELRQQPNVRQQPGTGQHGSRHRQQAVEAAPHRTKHKSSSRRRQQALEASRAQHKERRLQRPRRKVDDGDLNSAASSPMVPAPPATPAAAETASTSRSAAAVPAPPPVRVHKGYGPAGDRPGRAASGDSAPDITGALPPLRSLVPHVDHSRDDPGLGKQQQLLVRLQC